MFERVAADRICRLAALDFLYIHRPLRVPPACFMLVWVGRLIDPPFLSSFPPLQMSRLSANGLNAEDTEFLTMCRAPCPVLRPPKPSLAWVHGKGFQGEQRQTDSRTICPQPLTRLKLGPGRDGNCTCRQRARRSCQACKRRLWSHCPAPDWLLHRTLGERGRRGSAESVESNAGPNVLQGAVTALWNRGRMKGLESGQLQAQVTA